MIRAAILERMERANKRLAQSPDDSRISRASEVFAELFAAVWFAGTVTK